MDAPAPAPDALAALLHEAVTALRATGRIVQKLSDDPGLYRVDGCPPISSGAVVVLAWELGLMGSDTAVQ